MGKIAIYGGSFDPIHYGHLIAAEYAADYLNLDKVLFVPTFRNPRKSVASASGLDRLRMVDKAIKGNPRFESWDIEIKGPAVSYTIKTANAFQLSYLQRPTIIVGSDAAKDFDNWQDCQTLGRKADFAILNRSEDATFDPPQYMKHYKLIPNAPVHISSTWVRQMIEAEGSIRYLVPPGVEEIIRERKLYV